MKKPNHHRSVFLTLALLIFSLPVLAEDPWYKVEVLVFAHNSQPAMKEQAWRDEEVPRRAGAVELGNGGNGAYQRLPGSNLVLTAEKNRLAGQAAYRTLFHGAWYQPVGRESSARPVHIRGGNLMANGVYELDGYVSIDRGRFLHFRPDLYYSFAAPASSNDGYGSSILSANLDTPRRMRSDEIHYLDHPLFGVLVLIQR
ncbi:CsiV family protein [Marinobacterium aestuariivivens]|uniref:CsiV family protein n=1 Tax=Marinobacterium aestuariivivens TaxID=1698799 RepID=A0ABW2A4G8_9GAMM